ncbi:SDR family NAD(P)-dependent oxidoreductase [Chitinophaga ginsengisoli]|uniref:NADP-dependent 3-hydroxy acid dehydrogenase YdfG n=1 Tax=Chitinophaga ginsengisoli TaxID=363837 RepID=A0A2P8G4F8_9BACT|nr:SDR family NAD(P)-dependent oxidoreductase [Chitinophaga ginsengisoli]PSL28860.1 NADP-dependent 3-hydroxy acid dehydrogenase YdfG [Chitinophaga ginsengisoli]
MSDKKVWFVTGASKGLGLSLVKQLLATGQLVAATSRKKADLINAVGIESEQFLPLETDLTNETSVANAIDKTIATFDRIDVVVNNAGYGIGGSIEELSDDEARDSFDVNVFGTLNVIRKAMPYMRAQRSGHIINISSIAGIAPATGWAVYGAAKHAVIGLSEVLAEDVKEFGIKVTVVAPGAFRTSFLTEESLVIAKEPIPEYSAIRSSHERYKNMDGTQIGSPEKAANALIAIVNEQKPPVYLLLGSDAYARGLAKLELLKNAFKEREELTMSTDF